VLDVAVVPVIEVYGLCESVPITLHTLQWKWHWWNCPLRKSHNSLWRWKNRDSFQKKNQV